MADSCILVGRILHHVQDMSTPSHVVPVYHGLVVKDRFETHLHQEYLNDDVMTSIMEEVVSEDQLPSLPEDHSVMAMYIRAGHIFLGA